MAPDVQSRQLLPQLPGHCHDLTLPQVGQESCCSVLRVPRRSRATARDTSGGLGRARRRGRR